MPNEAPNPPQPDTPEAAKASIAAVRGGAAMPDTATWTRLHELAYGTAFAGGESGVDSLRPDDPTSTARASVGNEPVVEGGVLEPGMPGFDEANAHFFAGPKAPHEYQFMPFDGKEPSDADVQTQLEIQQALFAEGFPTFAAHAAHDAIARSIKGGTPDAAAIQASISTARAELTRRHGAEAQAIIADARKMFERLDARSSKIGDMLINSGAINNAGLLETWARVWRLRYAKKG